MNVWGNSEFQGGTMNQGGKMSGEMLLLFAAFVVAIVGVFRYISAENNDFDKFAKAVEASRGDVKALNADNKKLRELIEKQDERIDRFEVILTEFRKVAEQAIEDTSQAQDHMARLRDSQIDLRDRSYPRTVELKLSTPTGPIPVEIYSKTPVQKKRVVTRTTKAKTKTGAIVSRSETRVSPLKGDPDALPKKKATKKKATKKKTKRKSSSLPGLEESKAALARVVDDIERATT